MAFRCKKKVMRLGASSGVTLPQAWVRFYGNRVEEITLMGGSILLIVPLGLEAQAEEIVRHMEDTPMPVQDKVGAPAPTLTEGGNQA